MHFENPVAFLFDSEIFLERCCFLNSFSKVRFSSSYAKAVYNKEEKTAKFRKALI